MKKCSKCEVEKELSEFYKDKSVKCGIRSQCKSCVKAYREANKEKARTYRKDNSKTIATKKKAYYKENKKEIANKLKIYHQTNKEKLNANKRKYYQKNKEKVKNCNNDYRERNREKMNNKSNLRNKKRRESDSLFRITSNVRSLVYKYIKNGGYVKKSKTEDILGCNFKELEKHLNSNPYNFTTGDVRLNIDHIVPVSRATSEEELLKLNHYTNLQLLPDEYNKYVKSDKDWDKGGFEEWLGLNWSW